MTKVYAIVSLETPFQQYRIWGIATSRAGAKIACKTVKANIRAHGILQLLDFELDELCPPEGTIWRVVMTRNGGGSQATRVKCEEGQIVPIVQLECGSFLAFVDTEFKEDATSEANSRRIAYKEKIKSGTFQGVQGIPQEFFTDPRTGETLYDRAMACSAEILQQAHDECDVPDPAVAEQALREYDAGDWESARNIADELRGER